MIDTQLHALSVSELNRQARSLLESSFLQVQVKGELSNLARPASGHWYFTLKDAQAQVRCAMFRNRNSRVSFQPKEGEHVIVSAKVSLYEGRGDYQLIVETLRADGEGQLQRAFLALKDKLHSEGLFQPEHKHPLPPLARHVGLITSPSGAAVHDILTVLKRRFPALPVTIYPAAVQGSDAPQQLIAALQAAQRQQRADVLIISRGGGSLEDLWAFNDEQLARAIYACSLPVISAVGHEVDITIADLVADVRAPTPSAAAELVSPDQNQLRQRLDHLQQRLLQQLQRAIYQRHTRLLQISKRLQHPKQRLQLQALRQQQLQQRLVQAWQMRLQRIRQRLHALNQRLHPLLLARRRQQAEQQLQQLQQRSLQAALRILEVRQQRLQHLAHNLHTLSPLATLQRGYAIVADEHGRLISRSQQLATGQVFRVRLHQGHVTARVESLNEE